MSAGGRGAELATRGEGAVAGVYAEGNAGFCEGARVALGSWPTPLEPLARLGAVLDVGGLWVKREDLSARPVGGNKLRGVERLFGEARARGARRVLAYGPRGSNWVLAAATYAADAGLECEVVTFPLERSAAWATPELSRDLAVRARLAARRAAWAREVPLVAFPWVLASRALRRGTWLLPPGGTSTRSVCGQAAGVLELRAQLDEAGLTWPARLYVALGSGGTAAGLLAGLTAAGAPTRLVAVRASPPRLGSATFTRWLARRALRSAGARTGTGTGASRRSPLAALELEGGFLGRGYRDPTPEAESALSLCEAHDEIRFDVAYVGKVLAALRAHAHGGALRRETVLVWGSSARLSRSAEDNLED